ncbi:class I adenylate-forming enzyme family protein [Paraburkholderia solisilvae]|uniref:Long-chain-fatty-acid--CoA ligase n=1 Tax=Paraburkholderia solisilvae TaxID=624376 RepID=A0A6J5DTL6_9BURK|nr:class I adenylate-forming enzyme family protein [Paraburkholderia solisilvae]CAB3756256.1 Long-chain-fatty-acid--CoA ligase [Paraburkholderia solisilvae]
MSSAAYSSTVRQSEIYLPIDALRRNALERPDFIVMTQGEDNWTYERFADEVRRLSRGFVKRGVKRGDRIVLHLGNSAAAAIASYAAMMIGAMVFPMNYHYAPGEVKGLIGRIQPTLYLGHGDVYGGLSQVDTSLLPVDRRFIVDGSTPDSGVKLWSTLFDTELQPWPSDEDYDAPIILVSTSGTTSEPKLVVHTQNTVQHTITAIVDVIESSGGDPAVGVDLAATPMFHSPGWLILMTAVTLGRKFVWPESREFDANAFLNAIERHRCTILIATPFGVAELIDSQRANPRDVSSLSVCYVGGDACRAELFDEFERVLGKTLLNGFALSEALGCLKGGLTNRSLQARPGAARVVDEQGNDTKPGEVGELILSGENVFKGYWKSPGVIDDVRRDGWFYTGDLVRKDEQGDIWFVSRRKEIIVRDGENIAPIEIEQRLLEHPYAADAAVAGVPDARLGERIVGFMKLTKDAGNPAPEEVLRSLSSVLAAYKIPEFLFFVDHIPRTAWGKADRRKLRAMATGYLR